MPATRPRASRPAVRPAAAPSHDPPAFPALRWPALVGVALCVLGLAVASYLTYAHYNAHVTLACPDHGFINCAKVTSSKYSKILGIPVAVLGLAFFASMLPLQLPVAWRSPNRLLRAVRMGSCVIGVGFVLWLLYAELLKIRNICIYCTSVHILTFAIFVTTAVATVNTMPLAGDQPD